MNFKFFAAILASILLANLVVSAIVFFSTENGEILSLILNFIQRTALANRVLQAQLVHTAAAEMIPVGC